MNIECFDDLLQAARSQPQPQCLLFVFAGAELPEGASPQQRTWFEEGTGGELAPLMCVHKSTDELTGFDALVAESESAGPPWAIVFTGALSGQGGQPPTAAATDAALQSMVDAIKVGRLDGLLPFNRTGVPVLVG